MRSTPPLYSISTAAELAGVHPQTLRSYESAGLIKPARTAGGTRRYSDADLTRVRLIQQTASEYRMSLEGVAHTFAVRGVTAHQPAAMAA